MRTCVELFAGMGGASIGLRSAGFESNLCVEWDADACSTLRGLGFSRVSQGDVRDVNFSGVGQVGILWSSPPCQPFSAMGLRQCALDDRNGWPWTFDALDKLDVVGSKPTWVVCENVTGILSHVSGTHAVDVDGCRGCYWEHVVLKEMQARYACVDWRVIDAADFGVPQHRERVFLVAGPTPMLWPLPTHSRDALLIAKWETGSYWTSRAFEHEVLSDADRRVLNQYFLRDSVPTEKPWVTVHDALGLGGAVRVENTGAVSRSVHDVSPTLGTRGILYTHLRSGEVRSSESSCAETGKRRISVPEYAVLQGFDRNVCVSGSSSSQYRQIGNAVPSIVAFALGQAIANL